MTTELTTNAPTESTKDALLRDVRGIVGKADNLLHNAGQSVSEEFSARRHAMSEKASVAANATQQYVRSNPWKIIGVAAAVGAFVGALISRR